MERPISGPSTGRLTPSFHDSSSRSYQDWDAPSQLSTGHSQVNSVRSSDSGTSFGSHSGRGMNRGNGGYRGGRGGRGRAGFSGGRGNRKCSSSSGSSNGQHSPVARQLSAARGRVTPVQRDQGTNRADAPVTPNKEQSSFSLSGNSISETYSPSKVISTPSPRFRASPYRHTRNNYGGNISTRQHTMQRPVTWNAETDWALQQEFKIKVLDIPKAYSTKQIFHALSQYGHVTLIRIEYYSGKSNALVLFRTPLHQTLPERVAIDRFMLKWQQLKPEMRMIPSPVDPSKHYHELNTLLANSIDFGAADEKMSMIKMHTVEARRQVRFTLNLGRKELDIQFPQEMGGEVRRYRFRLPFALLSHVYKNANCALGQTAIIIPFESPPQFFVQVEEGEKLSNGIEHTSFSTKEKIWKEWNTWFRETDVVDADTKKGLQGLPLMNHKKTTVIDIGRWTSYRLLLDNAIFTKPQFVEFASALADHGVEIKECADYDVKSRVDPPLWTLLQEEISGTHPDLEPPYSHSGFESLVSGQVHLPFPIRYQLEACLSNGYLKEHRVSNEFLEKVGSLPPRQAIYLLEKVVDKQQVYFDPMEIFKIRVKDNLEQKVPSYCIMQRSAIITPTTIHVASPIMETSNRITRKYAADADRFLRIKFSDEKTEGVLRNTPIGRAGAPFDRVRRAMKNGIVVAGRYYEFLAFGNSQFREHGAYFYAPTSSKDADDIRSSLGKFDHIKTVAKFGARLGQCFSTTRAMRVKVTIKQISDIERNGYCFTDGVGKLSLFLAQMAAQELGLSNAFDDPPSLYQFRLGGCKGVLALDPKITGSEVHIRPSQFKFEADFMGLEIIRSSALATPFFNRQIIVVLSDLGVADHIIIRKQQEMVNDYEKAMADEEIAISKLRKHIDMNQTTLTMAGMVLDGFMNSREPFMMSLLKLWRAATIKNLKEKARIAIEDGAFVLGCADETATLKGHRNDPQSKFGATRNEKLETLPEIFLQVDDTATKQRGHYKIIEGICILARNPSLHPGDIRVVRAVNIPALHHLKNVVALPQTGDRDLANMCSGGDLDGDDYMVLWDVDLLPEIINVPPMDFTPSKSIEKDEPITVSDISEFFVTYMQNDSLGQIAHAHLAQADRNGVSSDVCLDLAQLHSQAVDYPKSGIPAQMSYELRPKTWPHFMEKKHIDPRNVYKSANILGKLYDQVELVDFKPQWENNFDERILNAYEIDDVSHLLSKATEIKGLYDEAFKRLMAKHGIHTEFEAWSVFVLAHNQESRDYKFAEEFGRTMGALKYQYKEICREAAEMTNAADWDRLGPFVAAMYTVTAREMQAAVYECHHASRIVGGQEMPARLMDAEHMPLISFPWLFPSELGKIATGDSLARQVDPPVSLQYTMPQPRRPAGVRYSETEIGEVETEGGVTHYGELLKLDFGVQAASHPAVPRHTSDEFMNEKEDQPTNQGKEKTPDSSGSSRDLSSQTTNATKEYKNELVRGGDEVNDKMQKDVLEVRDEEDEDKEHGSLQIKLGGKSPSVFEKLARFG